MPYKNVENRATLAVKSMLSGSTYLFKVDSLHQLSCDLAEPNFVPTIAQKLIFEQALRLLDLELNFQAAEHPDVSETLNHWLDLPG